MKMLINAARPQEVRAAILDNNGKLTAYELDVAEAGLSKGNVYVGTVANVEPSLNAAFVDFGLPKQGFLPVSDVCPAAYHKKPPSSGRPRIEDVLSRRRRILVQVVKDAIGNKGAALTTEISLAGRFVVLTPRDKSDGVSRKIEDENERQRLREIVSKLDIPDEYGLIVRTSTEGRKQVDIERDVRALIGQWEQIEKRAKDRHTKVGTCLFEDNDLIVRMLRDQFSTDIKEVLVDTKKAYDACLKYFKQTMPRRVHVVKQWDQPASLFSHFKLESQIAAIYDRRVELPSGGSLIIEPTEALTVVDVNSGRSTSQATQAETAVQTNLEAADEIARQLRLRDIGGLVVVDFIDMANRKHRRKLESRMKSALKADRARTYVGSISDNGLLEINRQRIKQALRLQTHESCPTCRGNGIVPGADFAALSVLRRIEERAMTGKFRSVAIDLHPSLADAVHNRYRRDLTQLEDQYDLTIAISSRGGLTQTEERLVWSERSAARQSGKRSANKSPAKAKPKTQSKRQPKQQAKKGRKAKAEQQPKPQAKQKPKAQAKQQPKTQAKQKPKTQAKQQSKSRESSDNQSTQDTPKPPKGTEDKASQSKGESKSRSRRRRRRRRSSPKTAPKAQANAESSQTASTDGAPPKPDEPKRSRRRRKKPQKSQSEAPPTQAKPEATRGRNKASQPKAGDNGAPSNQNASSGRTRSSRRSRRRRSSAPETQTDTSSPDSAPKQ